MAESDREKWDRRHAAEGRLAVPAPSWLGEIDAEIPRSGTALDVAAGRGRIALWLARRGLAVTAVDISPVGLALAREVAADEGVTIETRVADLERVPFPEGPFDAIFCFHYRQRSLFPLFEAALAPGGVLVAELGTVRSLERRAHPSRRWLAEPNELLRDARALEVVYYREAWVEDRHLARMVARRPAF